MKIRDYQFISTLNSGSTSYEYDIANYFNINLKQNIDDVRKELSKYIEVKEYKLEDVIKLNGKEWVLEKNILESTFEQWVRLETLLSEDDNVKNLHKLLAIYLRPIIRKGIFKRKVIEPFIFDKQDIYADELLELNIEVANSLIVFFYQNVPKFMNNIKIHYLNQMNNNLNINIKKR